MGQGFAPIEEIDELNRFLPARTLTTSNVEGVGSPDFYDDVSTMGLLNVLLRVIESEENGVLFADGGPDQRGEEGRKELYFKGGKLHHVHSNKATELLGEFLVRRQMISRDELDFALAVLPRYGGRMGDTLISLGLVSAMEIFRAIREQGRDRMTDLFAWKQGKLTLYFGQPPPQVEFALELELPPLVLAGMEAAQPGDTPMQTYRGYLDAIVGPSTTSRPKLRQVPWPAPVQRVLVAATEPRPLREVLSMATRDGAITASDALRGLQIALAAKLLAWM
jgi:serine/threonine-protein kinase